MRSGNNIGNNCGAALITESLGVGMVNDEFGAYYYYYFSTRDITSIIIVIFDQSVPECMIMIYLEMNGLITVLYCCASEMYQVMLYVKCVAL